MSVKSLANRTALVTGASRGIGKAIAEVLAGEGARIVACARSKDALAQLCADLPSASAGAHLPLEMDLSDPASIDRALGKLDGRVDILIHNAGIAESAPYHRTDDAMWERMMNVNALGVVRLSRKLIPPMTECDWGRVVIVASNAGLTGYNYSSAYCASKHAIIGWMRAVALEIAESGVTINAVCPGWVDTEMAGTAVSRIADKTGKSVEQARAVLERMSPQNRMVTPQEVAYTVAMLCGRDARSIHGQALPIDGGQLLR